MGPLKPRDTLVDLLAPKSRTVEPTGHIAVTGAATLRCVSHGSAKGKRTAADCTTSGGTNLSCAMIAAGAAAEWPKFSQGAFRRCHQRR